MSAHLVDQKFIRRLPQLTADAPDCLKTSNPESCRHCVEANAAHVPHKGSRYKASHVGNPRRHRRTVQSLPPTRLSIYMLDVLVDDHYRFLAVLPLKRKSEALAASKNLCRSPQRPIFARQAGPKAYHHACGRDSRKPRSCRTCQKETLCTFILVRILSVCLSR